MVSVFPGLRMDPAEIRKGGVVKGRAGGSGADSRECKQLWRTNTGHI
jgi:hypothetical protein